MKIYEDDELGVEDEDDQLTSTQIRKLERIAVQHRRFSVTLQPKQVYRAFRKTIKKDLDKFNEEELMTIFRVLCDAMNTKNEDLNLHMYKHIRPRVERAYDRQRAKWNRKKK